MQAPRSSLLHTDSRLDPIPCWNGHREKAGSCLQLAQNRLLAHHHQISPWEQALEAPSVPASRPAWSAAPVAGPCGVWGVGQGVVCECEK